MAKALVGGCIQPPPPLPAPCQWPGPGVSILVGGGIYLGGGVDEHNVHCTRARRRTIPGIGVRVDVGTCPVCVRCSFCVRPFAPTRVPKGWDTRFLI